MFTTESPNSVVERISVLFGTGFIAISTGMVTNFSTSSALRPGPLRNDGNLRIGNIRESINRGMHETDRSGDNGDRRQEKDKKPILERKRDNVVDKLVHPDLF